jgi:hypothetical protein
MLGYQMNQNHNWGIKAEIGALYGIKGILQTIDAGENSTPEAISAGVPSSNAGFGEFVIVPYVEVGISFQF